MPPKSNTLCIGIHRQYRTIIIIITIMWCHIRLSFFLIYTWLIHQFIYLMCVSAPTSTLFRLLHCLPHSQHFLLLLLLVQLACLIMDEMFDLSEQTSDSLFTRDNFLPKQQRHMAIIILLLPALILYAPIDTSISELQSHIMYVFVYWFIHSLTW